MEDKEQAEPENKKEWNTPVFKKLLVSETEGGPGPTSAENASYQS